MIAKLAMALMVLFANLLAQSGQQAQTDVVYIALGDSVAAGIGSSLPRDHAYAAILGEHYATHLGSSVRVMNLAVSGESAATFRTDGQLDEFRAAVELLDPNEATLQAVTLTLGGNDVLELRDEPIAVRADALAEFQTEFPAALQAVVSALGNLAPLYVSTIYNPTDEDAELQYSDAWWIEQFNAVIREAAGARAVTLVDLAAALGAEAQELTRYPADVHPTNDGHARIAAEFWRAAGLDEETPDVSFLSASSFNRFTPTVRFEVSPDTDPSSVAVRVADDLAVVYPVVQLADFEFAVLIDATALQPASLDVVVSAADAAGNSTEARLTLQFTVTP
jgi:lysophospholipase L1-like esterase